MSDTAHVSPDLRDTFMRVAEALQREVARGTPAAEGEATARFDATSRNRMLDACGSDHRPLVELLLHVGPLIQGRLPSAPMAAGDWSTARAPIVHAVVASRYLQPDVARWAVDAWASALGLVPLALIASPVVASSAPQLVTTPLRPPATPARSAALAPPARGGASRSAAQRGAAPFATGGAAQRYRIGSKSAPHPRPTVTLNPQFTARMQRLERATTVFFVLLAITVFVLLGTAIANLRSRERLRNPFARTRSEMPQVIVSTADAVAPATASSPAAPDVSAGDANRETMLQDAHDSAFVNAARQSAESIRAAVERGLGGSYTVAQQVRSVDGSASCSQVADALRSARTTTERFRHVPGSSALHLTSRDATGQVYDDGRFELGPRSGITNGVHWTFRMHGRFSRDGFTGQSDTETFAVIRWGRTQTCVTVADLVGYRVGA